MFLIICLLSDEKVISELLLKLEFEPWDIIYTFYIWRPKTRSESLSLIMGFLKINSVHPSNLRLVTFDCMLIVEDG